MPPSEKQTLAELGKLEQAYASNPSSDAYRPLAEAYLERGRFMEAMVVCKKGIKQHPENPIPRLLLARVYSQQGKDKKAIEELRAALTTIPKSKELFRVLGVLEVKNGETETGRANLQKAYELDPVDEGTRAAFVEAGMPLPAPAPPPSGPLPRASANPPSISPSRASMGGVRVSARSGVISSASVSASRRSYADLVEAHKTPPPVQHKRSSRSAFFALLLLIPLGGGAYYGIGQYRAKQTREANKLLREASEKLKTDTYIGYQQGIAAAENAFSLDGSKEVARQARGMLAYAYLVRWAEHQHDDANKEAAAKYLREGLAAGDGTSFLYAAEALEPYYNGNAPESLKRIEDRIRTAEAEKKQISIYYLIQGIVQMNLGALEDAKQSLEKAQAISPEDPRVYATIGLLQRRRNSDQQALQAYNTSLRFSRNSYPEALLGTAELVLNLPNPGRGYIAAAQNIKTVLEMDPPPSPRQLARAHFDKALLTSRLASDLPLYKDENFRKELSTKTGITADKDAADRTIQSEESLGESLDRNNPQLLMIRARRLAWAGKYDEAANQLRAAIELDKSDAQFQVELARVLMQKPGGDAQAEQSLIAALTKLQDSPRLLTLLAQTQYRQQKYAVAQATLERATRDEKQRNPEARTLLGRLLRDEKKDLDGAIGQFERAAKDYLGDSAAASVQTDLAAAYEARSKEGDKDRARTSYEKALNADKDYALAYCRYAKFLWRTGDPNDRPKAKNIATEGLKLELPGNCGPELQAIKDG